MLIKTRKYASNTYQTEPQKCQKKKKGWRFKCRESESFCSTATKLCASCLVLISGPFSKYRENPHFNIPVVFSCGWTTKCWYLTDVSKPRPGELVWVWGRAWNRGNITVNYLVTNNSDCHFKAMRALRMFKCQIQLYLNETTLNCLLAVQNEREVQIWLSVERVRCLASSSK